jgi:hypothetical protein
MPTPSACNVSYQPSAVLRLRTARMTGLFRILNIAVNQLVDNAIQMQSVQLHNVGGSHFYLEVYELAGVQWQRSAT